MTLRLLHTSDWHLGHSLHEFDRALEHEAFLSWLLDRIEDQNIDALLVAGDIFETANPSAQAQEHWYRFLAQARSRFSELDIVVIGGNHDSAARLDAPNAILKALRVQVVGGLPRREDGSLNTEQLLAPLHDKEGQVAAWVLAVPYLRPADLRRRATSAQAAAGDTTSEAAATGAGATADSGDPLVEGVRGVYQEALDAAKAHRSDGQALVAMGHCYMVGTALSELSERRILGGNQHALPVDIFDESLAYVALGHLHKAQQVGRDNVRYSGSPIPLSLSERTYKHQVRVVTLEGADFVGSEAIPVPRLVDMLRLPAQGHCPLKDLKAELTQLPKAEEGADRSLFPMLELAIALPEPKPELRREVDELLEGKAVRLVKLGVEYPGQQQSAGEKDLNRDLGELSPEHVFAERYGRDYDKKPPAELMEAFAELLEQVQQ